MMVPHVFLVGIKKTYYFIEYLVLRFDLTLKKWHGE
jgi:hypothetical protein